MKTSLTFFLLLAGMAALRAETLKVATLASNEEIRIEFQSMGCFHSFTQHYAISGSGGSISISKRRVAWNETKKKMDDLGVHALGTTPLSAEDRAGIDALFAFYRLKPEGGCTTIDHISVEYRRDGKTIGKESFVDATCATTFTVSDNLRPAVKPEEWDMVRRAVSLRAFDRRLKKKDAE